MKLTDTISAKRTALNFEYKHGDGSIERLFELVAAGYTLTALGEEFGLSYTRISQVFKVMSGQSVQDYQYALKFGSK